MASATISFSLDARLKEQFEAVCRQMGMDMSTALVLFCQKAIQEKGMPFAAASDPFYHEANIRHLEAKMAAYKAGRLRLEEHELR